MLKRDKLLKHYAKEKIPAAKDHIVHDFIHMKFQNKQIYIGGS
jgi:hypothetical protein